MIPFLKSKVTIWCLVLAAFTLAHVQLNVRGRRQIYRGEGAARVAREELVVGFLPVT